MPTAQCQSVVAGVAVVRNVASVAQVRAAGESATSCMSVRIAKVLGVRHSQSMARIAGLLVMATATSRLG